LNLSTRNKNMTNKEYETRVRKLEDEGMTRSDAQAIVDMQEMRGKVFNRQGKLVTVSIPTN